MMDSEATAKELKIDILTSQQKLNDFNRIALSENLQQDLHTDTSVL